MRNRYWAAVVAASGLMFATQAGLAAPLPDAVPVEVMAAPPAMEGFQISPNGTKVAGKVLVNGEQKFVILPIGAGAKPAVFSQEDVDVNWWRWVNDDWLVVGLGTSEVIYNTDIYITRVAGFKSDLSQINKIDWQRSGARADDVIWVANDGSTKIRLQKMTGFDKIADWDYSVFEADVATGKAHQILGARDGVEDWVADSDGNVRVGFAYPSGGRDGFSILYRDDDRSSFTKLTSSADPEKALPVPVIFGSGRMAYTIDDPSGFDELYELSLPDFKLGKKLFGVPGYDIDSILTVDKKTVLGAGYVSTNERSAWFDPALKDVQKQLDAGVGAGNARVVSMSRDQSKLLLEVGDASQVGGTYILDTKVGKPSLLGWSNATLKNRRLSPVRTIEYTSRDGIKMSAILTLPRGREPKNLPLIVMPHGGPHVRDEERFDWWSQYLAELGYAVIQPNYRGSTGFGAKFLNLGDGEWGLKMQDDLVDAIGWAEKAGIANAKRVCIVGASYGGYAALRAAQRDGAHYRCAVSFAGVADLNGMMKYDRLFLIGEYAKKYWKEQAQDFQAVSPRFHAAEFSIPVLVAHGAKDRRVPIKQSRQMVDELRRAGRSFEYLEQPKGDHHFSRTEDRLEFLKAMQAFLAKHNPV